MWATSDVLVVMLARCLLRLMAGDGGTISSTSEEGTICGEFWCLW